MEQFVIRNQRDLEMYDESVLVTRRALGMPTAECTARGLYILEAPDYMLAAQYVLAHEKVPGPEPDALVNEYDAIADTVNYQVCLTEIPRCFHATSQTARQYPHCRYFPCRCGLVLWAHYGRMSIAEMIRQNGFRQF